MKNKQILPKAYALTEITPLIETTFNNDIWLSFQMDANEAYTDYPEVISYKDSRYYRMSYSSDTLIVLYKEAQDRDYVQRYS